VPEGRANQAFDIPPLVEQLDDVRASIREWNTWVVRVDGRLVASMRGRLDADGAWEIGRLMVAPDLQGRGIGRWLLEIAEAAAPAEADRVWLVTGDHSTRNQRFYRRAGYRAQPTSPIPGTRRFVKVLPQT
jgi:tRNA (guanine37-N1)-methyltransferase